MHISKMKLFMYKFVLAPLQLSVLQQYVLPLMSANVTLWPHDVTGPQEYVAAVNIPK